MHWIILGILVLLGAKGAAAAKTAPTPGDGDEKSRYRDLRSRAAQGASLVADFAAGLARMGVPIALIDPAGRALARWAGIESGGVTTKNTTAAGMSERGLLQATLDVLLRGGGTTDEWNSIVNPETPRATQIDIMLKYLKGLSARVSDLTGWGYDLHGTKSAAVSGSMDLIWACYVYHALPIVLVEMKEQNAIGKDRFITSAAWRSGEYKPSAKAMSYGKPTADARGLYMRFGIAANVVADG